MVKTLMIDELLPLHPPNWIVFVANSARVVVGWVGDWDCECGDNPGLNKAVGTTLPHWDQHRTTSLRGVKVQCGPIQKKLFKIAFFCCIIK